MRKTITLCSSSRFLAFLILAISPLLVHAEPSANIHQATLLESDQKTKEVSTDELRIILAERSAAVFDARPFKEYATAISRARPMFRPSQRCLCHSMSRMSRRSGAY